MVQEQFYIYLTLGDKCSY